MYFASFALCILIALTAVPAGADDSGSVVSENADPASQAVNVFRDPQTGQIRQPSADEILRFGSAASAVAPKFGPTLNVTTLPDGTLKISPSAASVHFAHAVRNEDGSIKTICNVADHAHQE